MIAVCKSCRAEYNLDPNKVPPAGGFFKCRTCGDRVVIPPREMPPATPRVAPLPGSASAPPHGQVGSATLPLGQAPRPPAVGADDDLPAPVADRSSPSIPLAPRGAPPSAPPAAKKEESFLDLPAPFEMAQPEPPAAPASGPDDGPTLDDLPAPAATDADDVTKLEDLLAAAAPRRPPAAPSGAFQAPAVPAAPPPLHGIRAEGMRRDASAAPTLDDLPVPMPAVADTAADLPGPVPPVMAAPTPPPVQASPAAAALPPVAEDDWAGVAPDDVEPVAAVAASAGEALEPSLGALRAAPAAPDLMNKLAEAQSATAPQDVPGDVMADDTDALAPAPDAAVAGEAGAGSKRKRLVLLGAAGVVVVVVVAVGALALLHRGPFAARARRTATNATVGGSEPVAAAPNEAALAPVAGGTAEAPSPTPTPVAAPKARAEVPALATDNVNTLGYRELAAATAELAKTLTATPDSGREGLLLWAWYRLATFGDESASNSLMGKAPKPPEAAARGELWAAVAGGLLLLDGKQAAARAYCEKLLKSRFRDSPALSLVAARTYSKPAEVPKALKHLEAALAREPHFVDAQLLRARLRLAKTDSATAAAAELVTLATSHEDPTVGLDAVVALVAAGRFDEADAASAAWKIEEAADVAAARRDTFSALLTRRRLREGDLAGARAAAEAWVTANPGRLDAVLDRAFLQASFDGAEAAKQLAASAKRFSSPEEHARLSCEQARLLLAAGDIAAAGAALSETGGNAAAVGWLKYGQGIVAEHQGQAQQARAAYAAAALGRPLFAEPQVALAELGNPKPAQVVAKLTLLAKRSGSPMANYHLARALMRAGNATGAAALFDKVLWTDPTVAPARELLSAWVEALDLSGRSRHAAAVVQAMRLAQPKDEFALHLALGLAERAGKPADAVEVRRILLSLAPEQLERKIDFAAALTSDGKGSEAERMLTDLQRQQPTLKNPELVLQLGRAWAERDPVKARMLMQDSITLAPRARSYATLGELEAKLGSTDEAAVAFRKALELEPDLVELRYGLVRIMMQKRAFADAATELRRLVSSDPKDARAREMLGDTMQELDDPKAAAAAYQGAIDAGGERAPVLMKLARIQLEQLGLLAPAAKTLRRVVKLDPKVPEAHYYLGLALKDLGKNAEARGELKTYVVLAPKGEFAAEAQRSVDDLERTQ